MKSAFFNNSIPWMARWAPALLAAALLAGCGGGGGSGGSSSPADGIDLLSITFPKYTDLSGATQVPPSSAPLSQQVVFTFSGKVLGDISSSAIRIHAKPGFEYTGPLAALDKVKNILPARGAFEVFGNVVVFTPFIPSEALDLSPNAALKSVPGLLPGFEYTVFIPLGTSGAVQNLLHIDDKVSNPTQFATVIPDLPSLFFINQPALPPKVTATDPVDGAQDFPAGTFSGMGFPPDRDIVLSFDQPLDFSKDNLEGTDRNGNGVKDQHLFLEFAEPVLHAAVDQTTGQPGYIARLNTAANHFEFVGYTDAGSKNVGLKSVVLTETFKMIGCDGNSLYDVGYEEASGSPPVCPLTNERSLSESQDVLGLTFTRDGALYALDVGEGKLIRIDPPTGELEVIGALTPGLGPFRDMALGRDNELYALRVYNPGSASAVSSIERIDRQSGGSSPFLQDLPGDYSGMAFPRDGRILLFESFLLKWVEIDTAIGKEAASGDPIIHSMLPAGSRLVFDLKRYELGATAKILDNSHHGATVRIDPSGILPFGTWIDVMTRFSLRNVSGGSLANNEGLHPLGASAASRFRTFDPGPQPIEDRFLELFLDNAYEETEHKESISKALWNVQDKNKTPPEYRHLLAGLGWSGGGELGDFKPNPAVNASVILDTNYQPLPLYDGSTPNILEPTAVAGGEYHFHDILIPDGVTVIGRGSNPLVLTATGRVEISGIIDVSGGHGEAVTNSDSAFVPTPSGPGGAGGGRGGVGQPAIPPNFQALTELQSVPRGERGFGPANIESIGGQGGESGADGTNVNLNSSGQDDHRAAGAGGGTFLQAGHRGYPGRGKYGVDDDGIFYVRDPWDFWDGAYKFVEGWDPSHGDPPEEWKINQWFAKEDHRHPRPGDPGHPVFKDTLPDGQLNKENDFIGENGELKKIQGGQGGGGGGSRLDSMNPAAKNQAANQNPPLAPSAFDAKGGGGGGGGGACAIYSLGEIVLHETGAILANGGQGGGGEILGAGNLGGGGGGGSGGAILLNSATRIAIAHDPSGSFARLDVSGGWGADARLGTATIYKVETDPCKVDPDTGQLKKAKFCSYSISDGGCGGHGLIQLMVPDPSDPAQLSYHDECIEAFLCVIDGYPQFPKTEGEFGFSYYHVDIIGTSKPFIGKFPTTTDCLAPPEKTVSTITPHSFAVSKWIDFGQVIRRPPIEGAAVPVVMEFEGIAPENGWGVVRTQNGFVVNSHIPEFNDIEVDAPDLGLADYIPDANEVAIQFQGTDALVPGSKVPDMDPGVLTDWTPDLATLSGRQFIRFRVRLDVAKDAAVAPDCLKPQVNRVRLRVRY